MYVFLALIIVMIIILIYMNCKLKKYMTGMWVGDTAFLKKADLNDFKLLLTDEVNGRREGYLIIVNNKGELVSNQPITLTSELFNYKMAFDVESPSIPEKIQISTSMCDGTLIIKDDKDIYAKLRKDFVLTDIAESI